MLRPATAGSSPLARGLRTARDASHEEDRIIPARAGFTPADHRPRWPQPDHPRSRGVYGRSRSSRPGGRGSSPLARGLPAAQARRQAPGRIIPARAGFTPPCGWAASAARDHPRSRGVYTNGRLSAQTPTGSSPLARGLRLSLRLPDVSPRIIPARAGFTTFRMTIPPGKEDHPRSRGVYPSRSRGAPDTARIIPARAGFTAVDSVTCWRATDHPRSRGVYVRPAARPVAWAGSSPLARGLLGGRPAPAQEARIIPARAGFTRLAWRRPWPAEDHPRSRGVYAGTTPAARSPRGSSPLARGLRYPHDRRPPDRRIIPARAGFTRGRLTIITTNPDHPRSRGVYTYLYR